MANFCTKCGKKLEAGEEHTCEVKEETKKEETKAEAKTATTSSVDVKGGFTDAGSAIKGIFTKPIDVIESFVTDSKFIAGIILIVMTALAKGLSTVITLWHAFDKVKAYSSYEPKYFDEFFKTFATDLVRYAGIAFIAYLVITVILKGKATWKETLAATGLSLIVIIATTIVSTILIFFEGDLVSYIGGYVATFGSAFCMFVLYEGMKAKAGIDKNKLFLSLASVLVGAEIIVDIVNKIFS